MKTILYGAILCALSGLTFGQKTSRLFGAHSNGTSNVFTSITVSDGEYKKVSTLTESFKPAAGQTTFDLKHSKYFVKSGTVILIMDAFSGTITDSVPNAENFYNVEYDETSNRLVGIHFEGKSAAVWVYDLNTKISSIKAPLSGVDSIVAGESTFDQVNRRYFSLTNGGAVVVDSNYVFTDVLCASPYLNGMEYDPASNKIYYLERMGDTYDFVGIEANTCSINILNTFNGYAKSVTAESCFDKDLGHYYNKTNLGILQIDIKSGNIIQTLPVFNYFGGLEFTNASSPANIAAVAPAKEIKVFPNPGNGVFNFSNIPKGATVNIYGSQGQFLYTTTLNTTSVTIDLEAYSTGIYFYRIYNADDEIQKGKLILR